MRKIIDEKHISQMAASLDNQELGGAIRLLSRMISSGRSVQVSRAHIVVQMDEETWANTSPAVLEFFDVDDSGISHQALRDSLMPSVSSASKERAGRTADLPVVRPTRQVVVPSFPARDAPDQISIKKAAYNTMVRLCEAANQSENTARATLASLLKNWPEGDVYNAVYQCDKQDFIADPRSWILASLKAKSTPVVRQTWGRAEIVAAPSKKHKLSTPDALGVSETTAEKIRSKNRALGLNLTTPNEADA